MDSFDTSDFTGLTFESEFDAFLGLPANGGTGDNCGTTTSNASPYHHQSFGQPAGRDSQCPGCAKYKMDLDRLSHEHRINFQLLKKKIINTDLIIRKLKEQRDECDQSRAEVEEFKRKLDQATRDSEILSQQLSTAMANIKPLQEEKDRLQTQLYVKSRQVIELNDRIEGDRALKLQRTAQDDHNRNLEIEVTKLKKSNATLTSKTHSLTSRVKDLAAEKKCLVCSKSVVERRLDNLAVALYEAQEKCLSYWEKLRQHDLAHGENRPNFILSGFKSLIRRAVDKKNGIYTDPINETGNHEASDDDDNFSLHGGARKDDSDWDNISDVDSDDNNVMPQNGMKDGKRADSDTKPFPRLEKLPQSTQNSSKISPQKLSKPIERRKDNIEDTTSIKLPERVQKFLEEKKKEHNNSLLERSKEKEITSNNNNSKPEDTTSIKLPETIIKAPEEKKKEHSNSLLERSQEKNITSNNSNSKLKDTTSIKLPETVKKAPEEKKTENSNSLLERSKEKNITSNNNNSKLKDTTSIKLPETIKKAPEEKKKEHSNSLLEKSKEKNITSYNNNGKLKEVAKTKSNQNSKSRFVDSLDDSLSSLSSLASSDDDSDDANFIDEFLNFGSAGSSSKGKVQSVDLDMAFSFAEIQNLLSPMSVSSCPGSPLAPRPSEPVPLESVTDLSASPHLVGSPVSSLADIDDDDEDDTMTDCLFANDVNISESQAPPEEKMSSSNQPQMNNSQASAAIQDADTCVEVYVFKKVTPHILDEPILQSEVELGRADTCDSTSVIKATQASDVEVALPLIDRSLNTQVLGLKSPLAQMHQSVDTQSLHLSQTSQSLDTESLDLKSSSTLSSKHQSLNLQSFNIQPATSLPQLHQSLNITAPDTQGSDISAEPQMHQPPDTQDSDILPSSAEPQMQQPPDTQDPDTLPSPAEPQMHQPPNTQDSDSLPSPAESRIHQPPNTQDYDILSSPAEPQMQQPPDTQDSDILPSPAEPRMHQPPGTQDSNILPTPAEPRMHLPPNSQNSDILPSPAEPGMHQPPDTQDSDILPPPAEPQRHQPPDTQDSVILPSPAEPQMHQPPGTQDSDILPSPAEPQRLQPPDTQDSDILPSSAEPQMHQLPNTKVCDTDSSSVHQAHQPPDTKVSDTSSSSSVHQAHQPPNTKVSDTSSSSSVHQAHQPPDTKVSDTSSSSSVHQTHQPPNTKVSDTNSSSSVHQPHQPHNTKVCDTNSSSVRQAHQPSDTEVSDRNSSSSVCQAHQPPNTKVCDTNSSSVRQAHQPPDTKVSDINSSSVHQAHQPPNTEVSDTNSSSVRQVHQPPDTKVSDINSSTFVRQAHQPPDTKVSDTNSSSSVHQAHQPPETQVSDTNSSSSVPQRPQLLLLDVFNFFTLPPPLSPLPPSPRPHKRNENMPLIQFNSATPAKVPKVTPPAQVSRQATVCNIGSMSSQIIEARKLLVKRKAAASVKPAAVTNGTQRKRSSTVAEISPAGPTKRRKLASLCGFPNANAAVMYDLRQYLAAKDLDIKMAVETMLSRVEEGNTKAAWEALCQATISYLESTHQDIISQLISVCEKEGTIDTVFIREDERRLMLLISAFWRLDESLDRRQLMGKMWTVIFNQGCSNQLVRLSFCRMFTSLCLEQGDLEQARILMYSIAWCDYLDLIQPMMAIVGVWPEVLAQMPDHSKHCIKNVLGFMLRDKCKADGSLLQKVTLVLRRVCKFELGKVDKSPEMLLRGLLQELLKKVQNSNSGITEDRTFETMKTIELLLMYQGPEWTEKHFIQSHLVSLTMKWSIKRLDKTEFPDQYMTCLIRIFRAVITVQTPSVSSVGTVLGCVFPRFLYSSDTDTDTMNACIDALLELAPYNLEKSLDVLNKWTTAQGRIPAETLSKLQEVQSMLPKTIPQKKYNKGRKHKKPK